MDRTLKEIMHDYFRHKKLTKKFQLHLFDLTVWVKKGDKGFIDFYGCNLTPRLMGSNKWIKIKGKRKHKSKRGRK